MTNNIFSKEYGFKLKVLSSENLEEALRFQSEVIDGMDHKEWFVPLTKSEFLKPMKELDNVYMIYDGKTQVALFVATCEFDNKEYSLETENVLLIDSIMVKESYRGRGLQKNILKFLLWRAKELEKDGIVASVHPDNVYSLRNFLEAGYEIIGKKSIHGGPRFILYRVI